MIIFVSMMKYVFLAFLLLLLLLTGYVAWRTWCILPLANGWKLLIISIYALSFCCIFINFGMKGRLPMGLATCSYELGNSWLIFFLYALLFFVLLDLGRAVRLVPSSFLHDSWAGTLTVFGIITVLLVYGGIHYHHKYRIPLEIETEKPLDRPLTIVLASDLHAGYHNRRKEVGRWMDLINAENPDIVLIAGDIIDISVRPLLEGGFAEEFRRLNAPVYACLGNHEYISGDEQARQFFSDAGIHLLKDSAVQAEGIRIIGRDDRSNPCRAALWEIAQAESLFTILLDHQPYKLEEAEEAGIDFQFSGHTHHGQIWPGNWLTDMMYECAYGSYQKGDTRYYVSSGLGILGGKFRIGTRSEYVVLRLVNKNGR